MSSVVATLEAMGAWSEEPFGNDTAADWAWELDEADSWAFVTDVLQSYAAGGEEDQDVDAIAVAAAAVVAHGAGLALSDQEDTESVEGFLARVGAPPASVVALARAALDKVGGDSELAELWAESDEIDEWRATLTRVRDALPA
ncbi:hypothetical protein BWL13_00090 [Microbacterium oleivorans]|uniref:DUF4259 domain-containing protein n=1 Tax=Microbacterium oleivorans TaxID=273677 RepID=UPI0009776E38|nr:DUF4259 domain-containing protein [Microbacterium oleivorans]AZS42556.1 hypothetical protein BWL13_00090 [Microbacterium oleivorans]